MLERVDRMLLAVRDRALATKTFETMLGAQWRREESSAYLNAQGAVLALGESEIELWEPSGAGPVASQLEAHGEGLMFAGYASSRFDELAARLKGLAVPGINENGRIFLAASTTLGFPMVISPWQKRPRVGPVSFFYEATNSLQSDWRVVARRYAEMFGLDESRFAPISSPRFGYEGTLTLFDPVNRLDRVELSQTFADKPGAMRRFVERHGGDSLYMCFVETDDFDALRDRMLAVGASLSARGGNVATEHDTMWVHPKNLHGMLLGISRAGFAWVWSGQPDRVPALPSPG